ncbi:hypothetical protein MRX96_015919 [Rhipicephalus microplus]
MSIRQQVQWQSGHFEGYVDMGTGTEGDCLPQAKAAFVIMVVANNGHWKVPLGYFLVDEIVGALCVQRGYLDAHQDPGRAKDMHTHRLMLEKTF